MTVRDIDDSLRNWCARELGVRPGKQLLSRRGSSVVAGYRLADGRSVVVKARAAPVSRVTACLAVQSALFANNYPCPRPLSAVGIVDGLTVHAETFLDGGDHLLGDDARQAPVFARAYAELLELLCRLDHVTVPARLTPPPPLGWWTRRPWSPTNRLPDVVFTAADRVRDRLAAATGPRTVGHGSWVSRHLRWVGDRLQVAYSWDDLAWLPEALLVGAAAAMFPGDSRPVIASLDASESFVEHYQHSRDRRFSADELQVAWAGGLLPVLHHARDEVLAGRQPRLLADLPAQIDERLRRAGA